MTTKIIIALILLIAFGGFCGLIFLYKEKINRWLAQFNWRAREDKIVFHYLADKERILDVGCGDGSFMELFPSGKIMGIDIDPQRVETCQAKGLNAVVMDAANMSVNGKFDAIHCSHIIEDFQPWDFRRFLIQADNHLEAGGLLVIRTPLMWKGFYNSYHHIRPYPPKAVLSILPHYKLCKLAYTMRLYPGKGSWSYMRMLLNIMSYFGLLNFKKNHYVMVLQK